MGTVVLVSPAAQVRAGEPSPAEDFVEACSNGIAVADPEENPRLVHDCAVLLEIRDTLLDFPSYDGPGPLRWASNSPIRNWRGVGTACCPYRVTRIVLDKAMIGTTIASTPTGTRRLIPVGSIPGEIALLDGLETLLLSGLGLEGSIPPEIGELTNLRTLILSANRLTGSIPSSMGRLANLREMNLSLNRLSGEIPPELGSLRDLQDLRLHWNEVEGEIPVELAGLRVHTLWLHGNRLSGQIPAGLGRSGMKWLRVGDNRFSGCVPPHLRDVLHNDLDNLNLPNCPEPAESGKGAERGATTPEHFVEACSNGIAVADPEENPGLVQDCAILLSARDVLVGDAPSLHYGALPYDGEEIGNLRWDVEQPMDQWPGVGVSRLEPRRVTSLRLSAFILSGEIPPVLGSLSALEFLNLSREYVISGLTGLTGEIPPEIGALTHLRTLSLRRNSLAGEIPPELGNLVDLQWLDLRRNELTGELPADLGNLVDLRSLHLASNNLTGEFPSEMGRLTRLRTLSLFGNSFEGCLPSVLHDASRGHGGLRECSPLAPGKTGTGLAPAPPAALPVAVNVFAVVATLVAVLGIAAGLRTRDRP